MVSSSICSDQNPMTGVLIRERSQSLDTGTEGKTMQRETKKTQSGGLFPAKGDLGLSVPSRHQETGDKELTGGAECF